MKRVIIFAPNVGVGGGLVLLRAILNAWPGDQPVLAILDQRGRAVLEADRPTFPVHWFASSVSGRWAAERLLQRVSQAEDVVLCFHNLPPVLPNSARILCYVHGPHIVNLVDASKLPPWVRLRSAIERRIFSAFKHRVDRFLVQTPTMQVALAKMLGGVRQPIVLFPFVDPKRLPPRPSRAGGEPQPGRSAGSDVAFDFVYVSDGATHKNHPVLFRAWELLAEQGVYPSLALTLHPVRDKVLRDQVEHLARDKELRITDLGQMPHEQVLQLYGTARALLFASYAETFGIPLIEAEAADLPILAAEMDFVRDVCTPTETFDPHSPRSIARAVRRFLDGRSQPSTLRSPDELVGEVLAAQADATCREPMAGTTVRETDRSS